MSNCNCHKGIIGDGSGRLTRYLKALDPSCAPIDGRSLEELLVLVQQYATRIRFYDVPESKIKDGVAAEKISWENFFRRDMAVIAASIGTTDIFSIKEKYDTARKVLDSNPDGDKLAELFGAAIAIAAQINNWYTLAIPANPLHGDLDILIQSVLAGELQRILAYQEGYKLINPQEPMTLELGDLDNNPLWGTDNPIPPDALIYSGSTAEEKIRNAALYADEIFNSFYAALSDLTEKSDQYIQFALEQYPNHQPHMALFIAFLQLFQLAQQQMNGLTGRLLDYYYKEVLQLTAKNAIPDKVYVVFELAKNSMEYDLQKDTPLKAAKDDTGVDQIYTTRDDLVINRAKVQEIKTVFIKKEIADEIEFIRTIYANPSANSADGNGKPFGRPEDTRWDTFGNGSDPVPRPGPVCRAVHQMNDEVPVRNYAMPGFAIASPQLVLGGGNRLVMLVSDSIEQLINQLDQPETGNPLTIWMTGEQGWLTIDKKATQDELENLIKDGVFHDDANEQEPFYGYLRARDQRMGLVVYLPVSADPVIAFDEALHQGYHYDTDHPVMQVMLNPEFNLPASLFNQLTVSDFSVQVKVGSVNTGKRGPQMDGLKALTLQNDDQKLQPGKAFNPFTYLAGLGKSLYIGSEEVFNKPLTRLSVNIKNTIEEESRSVTAFILRKKQWVPLPSDSENKVFSYDELSRGILQRYLNIHEINVLDRHPVVPLEELGPAAQKGFIRLDNQTEFFEGEFRQPLSPQALAARFEIKEISLSYEAELSPLENGIDQFFHVYPFGVAEIKLDLQNSVEEPDNDPNGRKGLILNRSSTRERRIKFREIHPGVRTIKNKLQVEAGNKLLPQFTFTNLYDVGSGQDAAVLNRVAGARRIRTPKLVNATAQLHPRDGVINQYSGDVQEEGLLYIGLSEIKPLQSVSVLFQFAEGSAADEDNDPPAVHWSYLSRNQWVPLPGENLISDDTYGFQTTGIIKFSIPKEATTDNTIITPGLCWLRAGVTEHSDRIPMLVSVVTQAVLATFEDNNNSPQHYAQALAAGSVNKLKTPVAEVAGVAQPFSSFDGKPREVGREFYMRVSERLRHKQRAITAWDYERLILDRFSSVYKIKCISHTDPNCLCRIKAATDGKSSACCGPQIAPGHVLLVPIANLKNRNGVDPLQPKTARRVLIDMVNYVKNFTSPFVKVHAKNPVYEQIIVFFRVKFITGTDMGFYLKKLNDEIVQYLTPWAFDDEADVVFGQKVYASSIINFIEERTYVDFITDFEMGVCKNECCPPEEPDRTGDEDTPTEIISRFSNCNDVETFLSQAVEDTGEIVITPSTARSLLVSAPRHIIIPYEAPPVISPCERRKMQVQKEQVKIEKNDTEIHNQITDAKKEPVLSLNKKDTIKSEDQIVKKRPLTEKKTTKKVIAKKRKTVTKKTIEKKEPKVAKKTTVKKKKPDKPE